MLTLRQKGWNICWPQTAFPPSQYQCDADFFTFFLDQLVHRVCSCHHFYVRNKDGTDRHQIDALHFLLWTYDVASIMIITICQQCLYSVLLLTLFWLLVPSVLWRCWLGGRKGIRLVKNWVVRCWHGYLSGVRCRLAYAQLMPLPLTVSCFSKIQIGFTFLVPAHPGSPGKRAGKRVCVRVCVCWLLLDSTSWHCKVSLK